MNIFFSSDMHIGHFNVIKYSNRPYASVREMTEALIANWNSVVREGDHVYVGGDVSFTSLTTTVSVLQQLAGKKFLILGNHDSKLRRKEAFVNCFEWVKDYHELTVQDPSMPGGSQLIILSHYPMVSWRNSYRGSWMLHGHCHGSLNARNERENVKRLDIGVDCHNYTPVSYEQVKSILMSRGLNNHHSDNDVLAVRKCEICSARWAEPENKALPCPACESYNAGQQDSMALLAWVLASIGDLSKG